MGNVVSRYYHAQVGAALAERILSSMGMEPDELAIIMGAIGSHDPEESATAVSPVSAALIIADKSDVHRSRVRNPDMHRFDVHDRVNYAATRSFVDVNEETKVITLVTVDTDITRQGISRYSSPECWPQEGGRVGTRFEPQSTSASVIEGR